MQKGSPVDTTCGSPMISDDAKSPTAATTSTGTRGPKIGEGCVMVIMSPSISTATRPAPVSSVRLSPVTRPRCFRAATVAIVGWPAKGISRLARKYRTRRSAVSDGPVKVHSTNDVSRTKAVQTVAGSAAPPWTTAQPFPPNTASAKASTQSKSRFIALPSCKRPP